MALACPNVLWHWLVLTSYILELYAALHSEVEHTLGKITERENGHLLLFRCFIIGNIFYYYIYIN